jgi:hypothetical protein
MAAEGVHVDGAEMPGERFERFRVDLLIPKEQYVVLPQLLSDCADIIRVERCGEVYPFQFGTDMEA